MTTTVPGSEVLEIVRAYLKKHHKLYLVNPKDPERFALEAQVRPEWRHSKHDVRNRGLLKLLRSMAGPHKLTQVLFLVKHKIPTTNLTLRELHDRIAGYIERGKLERTLGPFGKDGKDTVMTPVAIVGKGKAVPSLNGN